MISKGGGRRLAAGARELGAPALHVASLVADLLDDVGHHDPRKDKGNAPSFGFWLLVWGFGFWVLGFGLVWFGVWGFGLRVWGFQGLRGLGV